MSVTCQSISQSKAMDANVSVWLYASMGRALIVVLKASRQGKILKKGAASRIEGIQEACFARLI
jgi:hypothetical protein